MKDSIKDDFHLFGNIWLRRDEKNFIGPGRIELLEQIMIHGSITKAAKAMKMSYKAAWDAVDAMNNLAPHPLVQRVSGGKGGGGTVVTAYAKELISVYRDVVALHRKHLASLESSFRDVLIERKEQPFGFSRITGTVAAVECKEDDAEIAIDVCAHLLTAQVPGTFLALYDLKAGDTLNLLIESDNIVLSKENASNLSSRNVLTGYVAHIEGSGNDALVAIRVCDDVLLTARITQSSLSRLAIGVGDAVNASFKAYNITILPPKERQK